jgi:hypothetical protein
MLYGIIYPLHAIGAVNLIFLDLIPQPTFENMEPRHCVVFSLPLFSRSPFILVDSYGGLGGTYVVFT